MSPPDRDFGDLVAEIARDHHRLKVTTKAIQFASLENVFRCLGSEHLKTTLGVVNSFHAENLHRSIESSPQLLTIPWLTDFKSRILEGPRSDCDGCTFFHHGKEFFRFFLRSGEVGVAKQHPICVGPQYSMTDGKALSTISAVL